MPIRFLTSRASHSSGEGQHVNVRGLGPEFSIVTLNGLAARLVHLKLQASADRERVRQLFVRYQNRIVHATDLTRLPEQSDSEFADEAYAVRLSDWRS